MADLRRKHGNAYQDWVEDWLAERGWSVHNQKTVSKAIPIGPGKVRWVSARNDILGMDLIAVRPGDKTLFVQATIDSSVQKRVDEIKGIGWDLSHQQVLLFQKKGPGSTTILRWDGAGYGAEVGRILSRKLFLSPSGGDLEL